jgi:hypothetical protein
MAGWSWSGWLGRSRSGMAGMAARRLARSDPVVTARFGRRDLSRLAWIVLVGLDMARQAWPGRSWVSCQGSAGSARRVRRGEVSPVRSVSAGEARPGGFWSRLAGQGRQGTVAQHQARFVRTRQGLRGGARQAWHHMVRPARQGSARQAIRGAALFGVVSRGWVCRGRPGKAGHGCTWPGRLGSPWLGAFRRGKARSGRLGRSWQGKARRGAAGRSRFTSTGLARLGRQGFVRRDKAGLLMAGRARLSGIGNTSHVLDSWQASRGYSGQGTARQSWRGVQLARSVGARHVLARQAGQACFVGA